MKNKCKDCGNCCLNTEMILSRKDIDLILENPCFNLREKHFSFLNNSKQNQLKNVDGHCVFFEPSLKECMIYDSRPLGCRFYPLIFDLDINQCKLDEDCLRKELFYENEEEIKRTCGEIKRYLKEELSIKILE